MEESKLIIPRVSTSVFKVGDKVRTRGDMGSFKLTVIAISNDHYCICKGYGKPRHFNASFLELIEPKTDPNNNQKAQSE